MELENNVLLNKKDKGLVTNSLIRLKISVLRDKNTLSPLLKETIFQIVSLMLGKVSKKLKLKPQKIVTPLNEEYEGSELAEEIILVPILRAALSMVNPIISLLPKTKVFHIGISRNEKTLVSSIYYENEKLKTELEGKKNDYKIMIVDPIVATANTILLAIKKIKQAGSFSEIDEEKITVFTVLISKQALLLVRKLHPKITIFYAEVESEVNHKGYLFPGVGDLGDRLFNTF